MNVLLIEDDDITAESIKLCLQVFKPDISLIVVKDGREALGILKGKTYNGVILDLGLPDLDGMMVLEEATKYCQSPIMVLTARHEDKVRAKALELGVKDYIIKPYDFHYLLKSIEDNFGY